MPNLDSLTADELARLRCLDVYENVDGYMLTVVERSGLDESFETARGFVATADAHYADLTQWSNCELDEAVFFERYADGVRVSHGWLDPVARTIAQVG